MLLLSNSLQILTQTLFTSKIPFLKIFQGYNVEMAPWVRLIAPSPLKARPVHAYPPSTGRRDRQMWKLASQTARGSASRSKVGR